MSKSIRRNDECPCGSGKKYKKCCFGKTDNPEYCRIENAANVFKNDRKAAHFKECIHPDKSTCSKTIISAHTIQNNKILSKISDNRKVLVMSIFLKSSSSNGESFASISEAE